MNDPTPANQLDPTIAPPVPQRKRRNARGSAVQRSAPLRPPVTAAEIQAAVTQVPPPQANGGFAEMGPMMRPQTIEECATAYDVSQSGASCAETRLLDCTTVQVEMPGLFVGDCDEPIRTAIVRHVAHCPECLAVLERYQSLDTLLMQVGDHVAEIAARPPAVVLPTKLSHQRRRRPDAGRAPADVQLRSVLTRQVPSPVGPLLVTVSRAGICDLRFHQSPDSPVTAAELRGRGFVVADRTVSGAERALLEALLAQARTELAEYFAGTRRRFSVPVDLTGVPFFTRSVLEAAAGVPFGEVTSYAGLAATIGKPKATRAVGNALGRNPVPIVVPCHRVVRSDRSLGGYTGGLPIKEHLLALEGAHVSLGGSL